jgi:magnesium transporter
MESVRTRSYRDGALAKEDFPLAEVSDHLEDPDSTVWVDLCAPVEADLQAVADELGLHELAVEDALNHDQRPKLDRYASHLFLTVYSAKLARDGRLKVGELSVFVTDRAVVTVRRPDGFDLDELVRRWDSANLVQSGSGFLLHGILDLVADGHLEAARRLDEELDQLEGRLFDERPQPAVLHRKAAKLRRSLSQLRRIAMPMREIVSGFLRHDGHLVGEELRPYFHDVLDHAQHTLEWTDSLREMAATIRETQLNIQGNQLNLIMKKVTGWAAVIAVPTAISGFYGMNVPYPGFQQPWGFWTSSIAIAGLSVGLYAFFKRRDWL